VLPTVVETVREALRLPYAAIALGDGGGGAPEKIVASAGSPVEGPLRLPLTYRSEPVGELLLGPRAGEGGFSAADRRLLEDLARQAGVAAHAVRLTAELQRSRERLVAAREEERRRLRRDLHDGLGAQLAGLNVQAGVLRHLIKHDPEAADALVAELRGEMRSAIADVRRLVYGLRPPALDELGLVGALRGLAERHGAEGAGLHVTVEAPEPEAMPPLPAAVEVAAYRIAQEAMTNVARHARASRCVVRLAVAPGELSLEVTDDGVGLPETRPTPGVGLHSMRERAVELGGECVVEAAPGGGTRVLARLPLQGEG
jgi:signal transduction histidine kinase